MALVRRDPFDLPDFFRRFLDTGWDASWLRVEEFRDGDTLVVRSDLPGIDPDKDVEISVTDGVLHVRAEREEKSEHKEKDGYRSEFRYGSFARAIPLPAGAREEDIAATYRDGVLEVRVPVAEETKATTTRVPISRS